MSEITTLIFDYGGTIDTPGVHWYDVIEGAYRAEGIDFGEPERLREAYVAAERLLALPGAVDPADDFLTLLRKKFALQTEILGIEDSDGGERLAQRCDAVARANTAEARDALRLLAQRYRLALVSNFYGNLRSTLRAYGLEGIFCLVIDSAEAGVRKPDPAIFGLALERLGVRPEEILVIGDSVKNDIEPPRALGCRTLHRARGPLSAVLPSWLCG